MSEGEPFIYSHSQSFSQSFIILMYCRLFKANNRHCNWKKSTQMNETKKKKKKFTRAYKNHTLFGRASIFKWFVNKLKGVHVSSHRTMSLYKKFFLFFFFVFLVFFFFFGFLLQRITLPFVFKNEIWFEPNRIKRNAREAIKKKTKKKTKFYGKICTNEWMNVYRK